MNSAIAGIQGNGCFGSVPYSAAGAMSPAVNAAAGNASPLEEQLLPLPHFWLCWACPYGWYW